jgi:hypothetical protein
MGKREEAKAKAEELRGKLRQLDALTGKKSERHRDAERKAAARKQERIVVIPPCEDPKRRKRLEKDIFKWLRWYFSDPYDRPFTDQIKTIILAILRAFRHGGDQSIAATRGEGKTTAGEMVTTFCVLRGEVNFAILFEATGKDAEESLEAIKDRLASNDRLAADYPEVCIPIRALNHTAQLARTQLVSGKRHDTGEPFEAVPTHFQWCGKEIELPHVPGSPAAGAIIATRGLDAAVRGVKRGGKALRPKAAIINDPDTDETMNNPEEQGKKLERKIERSIGGLGGQKERIARVLLTTIQRRGTVSHRFTDPKIKPSWKGKRFRFLVKSPERMDLWDEYVQLRQTDWTNEADGNPTDLAGAFYKKHFSAMNLGAVIANPNRRGDQSEKTALQYYFNEKAAKGEDYCATELDNDPPEESGPVESGITAHRVQRQLSGHGRRAIPQGCTVLVHGIDVRKVALHWVVRAFDLARLAVYTIDYGVHEVLGTTYGSDEGLELALRRAILSRMETVKENPYELPLDLSVVDASWQTDAIYSACAEANALGLGPLMPIMGFGKSAGCVQANFSDVQRRTLDRKPGDGWFLSRKGKLWLICADADRWKQWEHERWMTAPGKPGCAYLFGTPGQPGGRLSDDEKAHHSYSRHIVSEVMSEELNNRRVLVRSFKAKSDNNHYLDASYYADVAGNMKGFRITPGTAKPTKAIPGGTATIAGKPRLTLSQMAQQK